LSAGFLGRMADRSLGLVPTVAPVRPPLFAALPAAPPAEFEQVTVAEGRADQAPSRTALATPPPTRPAAPAWALAAAADPPPARAVVEPHIEKEEGRVRPASAQPPSTHPSPRPDLPAPGSEAAVAGAPPRLSPQAPLPPPPAPLSPPSLPAPAPAIPVTRARVPSDRPPPRREQARFDAGERHRPAEPAIHVSIGEIVVSMVEEKRTAPAGRPSAAHPTLTLEQYLRRRDGSAG